MIKRYKASNQRRADNVLINRKSEKKHEQWSNATKLQIKEGQTMYWLTEKG
jgi:hypothetical protein